jgi:5-methylcytosine-specific restriction endonuclease McrA
MKPFTRLTQEQKTRICQNCGKSYTKKGQSNKWFLSSKYCDNKCYYICPEYQSKRSKSISEARKGWQYSEETKKKISEANTGKIRTEEQRKKSSESKKGMTAWNKGIPNYNIRGDKHPNWTGKNSRPERMIDMGRFEYKNWRRKVFERDDYTCVNCNKRGGSIHADHIKPYSKYPELRYEISNGRTLCVPCHYKIGWNPYKELSLSHAIQEAQVSDCI